MFKKKHKDFSDDTQEKLKMNYYSLIRNEISNKNKNKEVVSLCNRQLIDIERALNDIIDRIKAIIADLKSYDARIREVDGKLVIIEDDYNEASKDRKKLSYDLSNSIINEDEFLDKSLKIDGFLKRNKIARKKNIDILCSLNAKREVLEGEYKALINKKRELVEKRENTQRNKKIAIKNIKNCDANIGKLTDITNKVDEYAFNNVTVVSEKDVTPKLKSMKKIK